MCSVEGAAIHFLSMVVGNDIEFTVGTMASKGKQANELVMKGLLRGQGIGQLLKCFLVMT